MLKFGMVLGAGAGDYRWNKQVEVAAFYFLYWKYLLLLISVIETVDNICFAGMIFCYFD